MYFMILLPPLFSLPCIPLSFPSAFGGSRPTRCISQIFCGIIVLSFEISARTTELSSSRARTCAFLPGREGSGTCDELPAQSSTYHCFIEAQSSETVYSGHRAELLSFFIQCFMLLGIFFCCYMAVTGHVNPGL